MNTRAVAKLLGISTSTVQRWVKQLKLEMERNELGHFIFSEEDIELLKQVKKQLQEGTLLQDISIQLPKRAGTFKQKQPDGDIDELAQKVKSLEISLQQKADDVVSYQILQHRREMEELQEQIIILTERVTQLENVIREKSEIAASIEIEKNKPRKKKSFFQLIFGS
ncbi:MerR family transcriptional regulator [Bacillus tuaregi]|uniref:MerR family transcriptional regulator n=1 Tax=Bacillus tuaregi TaxID=1816695 RepID=UPI0008F8F943|nr:MerR family transcriptional regulator [Bacillus tuaregi]